MGWIMDQPVGYPYRPGLHFTLQSGRRSSPSGTARRVPSTTLHALAPTAAATLFLLLLLLYATTNRAYRYQAHNQGEQMCPFASYFDNFITFTSKVASILFELVHRLLKPHN